MSALAPAERSRGYAADAAATQRLYEQYSGRLFGYCLKFLGTREEAEDAVQTTFLNAQRGLRRGVVPEFEGAWLYKIAQNVCRTRYDRSRRRPDVARDLDLLPDAVAVSEGPDSDFVAALPDALARMPAQQRNALLLREWQGLSYREIAARLETSEPAVETLLYRARRSLAANLEQPERKGRLSGVNVGSFVTFFKSLLTGGGVVGKVVVATIAVTATVTVVGGATHDSHPRTPLSSSPAPARQGVRAHPRAATRSVVGSQSEQTPVRPRSSEPLGAVRPRDPVTARSGARDSGPAQSSPPAAADPSSAPPALPAIPTPSTPSLPPPPEVSPTVPPVALPATLTPPTVVPPVTVPTVSLPAPPPLPQLP